MGKIGGVFRGADRTMMASNTWGAFNPHKTFIPERARACAMSWVDALIVVCNWPRLTMGRQKWGLCGAKDAMFGAGSTCEGGQVSKMRSLTNQFWHNYSLYSRTWMYNIPTQISSWGRIPHDMQGGTPFLNHQPSTPHRVQNVPVSLEHRVFGTTRV